MKFNVRFTIKTKYQIVAGFIVIFASVVISYQNCSDKSPFDVLEIPSITNDPIPGPGPTSTSTSTPTSTPTATPTSTSTQPVDSEYVKLRKSLGLEINLVANCFQSTSTDFNACIYWKNRIAQALLTSPQAKEQSHAVKIVAKSPGGELENANYTVLPKDASVIDPNTGEVLSSKDLTRALPVNGRYNFITTPTSDTGRKAPQVSAFFWLNAQVGFMKQWTGTFYSEAKAIPVYPFSSDKENGSNAYSAGKSMVFGVTLDSNNGILNESMALDGSIIAHEAGHTNLYSANPLSMEGVGANQNDYGCCSSTQGCINAVHEGVADYHSAIMFEKNTAAAELIFNNAAGLPNRDVSKNAAITSSQVYNRYRDPYKGESHEMGQLYASIWWEVRKESKNVYGDAGIKDIDTIFTNHLALLDNNATFGVACNQHIPSSGKAVLGKDVYDTKYKNMFDKQCVRVSQ